MHLRLVASVALSAIATTSLLATFRAGNARAATPVRHVTTLGTDRSWFRPLDPRSRLVYVSDSELNTVSVFDRDGAPAGKIAGLAGPEGIFVDAARNLWVANSNASTILEFARGSTSPTATLQDRAGSPSDVTICPNGAVYVSNISTVRTGAGFIVVYEPGATRPTRALAYPGELKNWFLTCDASGNVFTTITTQSGGTVVEYPNGRQPGARKLPIALSGFPGGIKINSAGNLVVGDAIGRTISEYTEAGLPMGDSIRITAPGSVCEDIDVTESGRVVGCALFDTRVIDSEGQSFAFPAGTAQTTYRGSFNKPIGFAYEPLEGRARPLQPEHTLESR